MSEPADWFDVEDYSCLASCTAPEIQIQLKNRRIAYGLLEDEVDDITADWITTRLIDSGPIWKPIESLRLPRISRKDGSTSGTSIQADLVRGLTNLEISTRARTIEWEFESGSDYSANQPIPPPDTTLGRRYVSVALEGRKSDIMRSFEQWLDAQHFNESILKSDLEKVCGKIINYRVIPYLDLQLWAKLHGKSYKTSALVLMLSPKGELSEEHLRKQTRNYADLGLSASFINAK